MNVLTRGIRNAFRNGIRTFSIIVILSLSIALALAMVMARGAVQKKIDAITGSIGTNITITPAGVRGFEGGGEPLKAATVADLKNIAHVSSISQSLQDRLDTSKSNLQSSIEAGSLGLRFRDKGGGNSGGTGEITSPDGATTHSFTPPIMVSANTDLSASEAAADGKITLTSGALFASDTTDNVALIGKNLATKNNLSVGSTFTAYDTTITVVGIYDTGTTFTNNTAVFPLATLQKLSGQDGQISSATVKVDSLGNVDGAVSAIKSKLGSSADVASQQSEAQSALAPLENIKTVSLFSLIGAVVAGSVIILLTMVMIVRERRREIGVLKAIGGSNVTVVTQFMAEAVTFTIIAAAVGILLGIAGGNPITRMLVNSNSDSSSQIAGPGNGGPGGGMVQMQHRQEGPRNFIRKTGFGSENLKNVKAVVSWSVLAYGLAAALVIALAGSAAAAFFIAKVRPAEVMRVE